MKTSPVLARRVFLLVLTASVVLASSPLPAAQAGPPSQAVSDVVPFLGVFVGWSHRNRIYRDANAFIADRNRYFDSLRDTARRQLAEREIAGLRTSQVAAYSKLVALIERNRQAETAQAEARKRQAREAFHQRLEGVLLQRVLGTEALQRLLGAMARGVDRGQGLIDTALDKLGGGGGGILAELERVRKIARDVEAVAGAVGGSSGSGLRRTAGRIASAIERPQQLIQADLERVRSEIGELGGLVDTLARSGRTPSAGALAEGLVLRPPGGSDDPAVEAIAALLSRLSVGNGSLRDQARAAIDAGFVARCTAITTEFRQALARLAEGTEAEGDVVSTIAACSPVELDQVAQETSTVETAEAPLREDGCSLTGEGDFVIENLQVSSASTTCEDAAYPFGLTAEPLLVYLATAGRWVIASDSPAGTIWEWQATTDLEGAIVEGTAQIEGGTLVIDATITAPPSGTSFAPLPSHANGIALAIMLPLFPLAVRLSSRKRRRLAMTAMTLLAFLLMAQSCEVYGSFSGHYTFPIPPDGFACEIAPDNSNRAELPGSRGEVTMQLTVADEDGANTCNLSASMTGLGVLKRDGVYTREWLEQAME